MISSIPKIKQFNLEKPKQRYIRLLENALFGFGFSKLGYSFLNGSG
jgi:hypothetical protein